MPGIVGWLQASPCESSPLSPGPEWQHRTLVGSRPPQGRPSTSLGVKTSCWWWGCSERLALSSSWNLVTLNRSVPRIFKSQRKICPACQGIGKGERARSLEWEPNWQSHTAPPDYGKAARRPTPTSTGCPAISAPICSGLRWPLTTPLFKGCGDQPVSCY